AKDMTTFITDVLKGVKDDLEEVFAYGRKFAERGGARFKTADAMWKYVSAKAGKNKHEFQGKLREKAVRKVVRTIVESNGGDGDAIKQDVDTNYKKGLVWWKDKRAAVWGDGRMTLLGEAAAYKEKHDLLHGTE
ncbi:unnamed protein product, partial [Prorocentrum cordatum]